MIYWGLGMVHWGLYVEQNGVYGGGSGFTRFSLRTFGVLGGRVWGGAGVKVF